MQQFQSPSGRVYNWNKPTPPTERDWEELIAFDKAQDAAAEGKQLTTNEVQGAASSDEALKDTVRGIGLEVGGSLAGGAIGTLLAPGVGTAVGATVGGSVGNFLKQLLEQGEGKREEIKGGQVLAAGILSAPGAVFSRAALQAARAGSTAALGQALQAGAQVAPTVGRTAAIRATQAGVAAAAANVTEKLIDEGRLPTWQETGTEAAIGAALGGAAGFAEGRYALKGGFITNQLGAAAARAATGASVAAYAYNDAVEKGKPNPIADAAMFGALAVGGTYLPAKIMQLEKDKARRLVLGPEAITGKDVVVAANDLQTMQKAADAFGADIGNELNKAIKESSNPDELSAKVISVMGGRMSPNELPESVRPYVLEWKAQNRSNSQEILARYDNVLDQGTKDTITENSGDYIRTAYAAHDPKATRGVDWDREGTAERYKAELVSAIQREADAGNVPMSAEQAGAKADAIMARMAGDVAFTGSGQVPLSIGGPGSPTSALQRKHDLSDAAREWLGEIKDPGRRLQQTLSAQSRLILHHEHDKRIRDLLTTSGIGSTSMREGYVKLIESDSPTLHNQLADLYVPKEWAEAWKEVMSPNLIGDGLFAKTYMKLTTTSKALKTVGNFFEAIAPQAWGNAFVAASSGKASPQYIVEGVKKAVRDLGVTKGLDSPEAKIALANELKELRGLGVLQGGAEISELQAFVRMASKENDATKLLDKFSKLYGSADTAFRYAMYRGNLEETKRFNLGLSEPDLKKYAAELTKNQFPTYEYIPRRLRQASAATAANSFGAFEFEMVRTVSNQVRYINYLLREGRRRMANTNVPGDVEGGREMVKAGVKRAMSLASVAGFTAGLATLGSRMFGTTEQDEKDISKLVPQYDANKANIIKLNKDGSFSYTPINYIMPYANMTETLMEGINGGNPLPYVKTMVMGDDLGPLVTPAIEAINNTYYKTDVPISEPRDNAALAMRFVQRAFLPQAITGTLTRTEKALREETNKLGTKYTLEDQGLRILGARQNTMDILGSATARIRSTIEPLNGEVTGYRRILKGRMDPTTGELRGVDEPAVYAQRARNYELGQKELGEQYMALKRLSERTGAFNDTDIINAFRQAGVPNRLIAGAVFGYTVPMPRGIAESNSDIIQDILAKPDGQRNILAEIDARSNGDPFKKRQLLNTYKQIRVNDARGGDAITKLFNGLGVSDGERADAIYRAMSARPEMANALKNKLVKTRVMSPDVYRQVKGLVDADVEEGR